MSDIFILAPDPSGAVCDCTQLATVCASCTPSTCDCSLHIPADSDAYHGNFFPTPLDEAKYMIATYVSNCTVFPYLPFQAPTTLEYSTDRSVANTLSITYDNAIGVYHPQPIFCFSLNLKAGSNLILNYNYTLTDLGAGTPFRIHVYIENKCNDRSLIEVFVSTNPIGSASIPIVDGNEYTVALGIEAANSSFYFAGTSTFTSSDILTTNPVVALYDNPSDPLVPYQLEACPKFQLPALSESSHSYYANLVAAQSEIDNFTTNCIAATDIDGSNTTAYSFSASGTTSLSMSQSVTGNSDQEDSSIMSAGFSGLNGDIITVSWVYNSSGTIPAVGNAPINIVIRRVDDTLVGQHVVSVSSASNSGSFAFPALPSNGKYVIFTSASNWFENDATHTDTTAFSVGITSSGTMSVNPIQALYTNGTNCPSRLDCTP